MKRAVQPLSAERARELLSYDAQSGKFFRRIAVRGRSAGMEAGHLHSTGYVYIGLDGIRYRAHRIAWLIVHGSMPSGEIDHINGDPADNRIANLRDVSRSINAQNIHRIPGGTSRSGLLGVSWHPQAGRWKAKIQIGGRALHLGYFDSPEAAHQVYVEAKRGLAGSME